MRSSAERSHCPPYNAGQMLLAPLFAQDAHAPDGRVVVEPWSGDAAEAALHLRGRPGLVWLDSALPDHRLGRWSIVASDPRWTMTAFGSEVLFDGPGGPRRVVGSAIEALASAVGAEAPVSGYTGLGPDSGELPFLGGTIGYLGFELGREIERLPATTDDDAGAPSLAMGWYDAAMVWDAVTAGAWLVGRPAAVAALRRRLGAPLAARRRVVGSGLVEGTSRTEYLASVRRALEYIRAGDIYQVNLSQRFSATISGEGFDLYEQLREASPAPFAAYLDMRGGFGGIEVLSSSPERFLLRDGDCLETRPIKGTRPRGASPAEDADQVEELRVSTKDRAEHVMIVDLERNDLGRISVPGSVSVSEFAALESYRHVHHLTSTVRAQARAHVGLDDLLRATFPGGSITGAPKIRAIEIIDELERYVRGVYTGSIGYISAHGRIDLNIAIRTIALADGIARFHVGGAIVHDSDPEAEYLETLHKARGMARALGVALPDEVPSEVLR
ncbi:MAG: aminodeoxychorismate synthase component I [Chloroflexi bacterium]|nr:aminodeoxychorismate synthase component I [Chloroflexota bacterium]